MIETCDHDVFLLLMHLILPRTVHSSTNDPLSDRTSGPPSTNLFFVAHQHINKKDVQCVHNVTLCRLRENTVAMEGQQYVPSVIVAELHVAFNNVNGCALPLKGNNGFPRLWSVWLYHIFPHYLVNGTISGKKEIFEHKLCSDFLYKLCVQHLSL